MKASDILKRKAEMKAKELREKIEAEKEGAKELRNRKNLCAECMMINFEKSAFNPDGDKDDILNFLAEHADIEGNIGVVSVGTQVEAYTDEEGCYKYLLPMHAKFWPRIDECISTKKVKPLVLKRFFEKVEKALDADCWWGYGYLSSTSYSLHISVSHNMVMHFIFRNS